MLVQHPGLPFLSITAGDYHPSSSGFSTPSTQHLPGAFTLIRWPPPVTPPHTSSTPVTTIFNESCSNKLPGPAGVGCSVSSAFNLELAPPCVFIPDHTKQQEEVASYPFLFFTNKCPPSTFDENYGKVTSVMPRQQSHAKAGQDVKVEDTTAVGLTFPQKLTTAGVKRDASALSGDAALPNTTVVAPLESGDQPTLRLPPKMKETERMMYVQRWVNHLPIPVPSEQFPSLTNGSNHPWFYSAPLPGYRHIEEDRELTPPPSKPYVSRLPFTAEEHQAMLRYFPSSSNSHDPRHQHYVSSQQQQQQQQRTVGSGVPYSPGNNNNQQQQLNYPSNRALASPGGGPSQQHHLAISTQASNQQQATASGPGVHLKAAGGQRREPPADAGACGAGLTGTRFFAEWEIRLIGRLFQEYFIAAATGSAVAATDGLPPPVVGLPSVSEVRSRIASSRLKETRTATAVRAKIKRMLTSGALPVLQ